MSEPLHATAYAGWVAVITGGAGGIGQATAARLIERGITCLLVDIDAAALERAAQALGPRALTHCADLGGTQALAELAARVDRQFGRLPEAPVRGPEAAAGEVTPSGGVGAP